MVGVVCVLMGFPLALLSEDERGVAALWLVRAGVGTVDKPGCEFRAVL